TIYCSALGTITFVPHLSGRKPVKGLTIVHRSVAHMTKATHIDDEWEAIRSIKKLETILEPDGLEIIREPFTPKDIRDLLNERLKRIEFPIDESQVKTNIVVQKVRTFFDDKRDAQIGPIHGGSKYILRGKVASLRISSIDEAADIDASDLDAKEIVCGSVD